MNYSTSTTFHFSLFTLGFHSTWTLHIYQQDKAQAWLKYIKYKFGNVSCVKSFYCIRPISIRYIYIHAKHTNKCVTLIISLYIIFNKWNLSWSEEFLDDFFFEFYEILMHFTIRFLFCSFSISWIPPINLYNSHYRPHGFCRAFRLYLIGILAGRDMNCSLNQ